MVITLEKAKDEWWPKLMLTDPEIEIQIPEEYLNEDDLSGKPGEILNEKNMASYLASHGL